MPRPCTPCQHPDTAKISKDLLAGGSLRTVADRYKLTRSAVGRHLRHCLRTLRSVEKSGQDKAGIQAADSARFDSNGRCRACGQLGPEADASQLDAPAIVRRAESLLARSERVAEQAEGDGDLRLVLSAVDRCQRSIDTLAKIAGILQPDNSVTVNVAVAESKKVAAWIDALPTSTLRAFTRGSCPHCEVPFTGETIDASETKALPA